jgi:hypothetical protein
MRVPVPGQYPARPEGGCQCAVAYGRGAGRPRLLRVFIRNPSIIENVSFVLEANQDYSIDYVYLGPADGDKVKYLLNFVHKTGPGSWKPVDVDHWTICRREKGLPAK